MLLINLIVNYLYRKYGVPLHNFFENWSRGTSHLRVHQAYPTVDNLLTFDSKLYFENSTFLYYLLLETLTPPGWSHLWFAGVRECPPWCSIVGDTVTVHQFFCILHCIYLLEKESLYIYKEVTSNIDII